MATEKTHITVCGLCAAEGTVVLRTQDNDGNYKALPTYRLECTACNERTAWRNSKAEAQDEWNRMLGGGMGSYTEKDVLEAEARAREAHRDAVLDGALVKQAEQEEKVDIRKELHLKAKRDAARAATEAEIENPPHYTQLSSIEPIDIIEGLNLPYHLGCALKYIWRWDAKDQPLKNLKKCRWYLDRYITELECSRDG